MAKLFRVSVTRDYYIVADSKADAEECVDNDSVNLDEFDHELIVSTPLTTLELVPKNERDCGVFNATDYSAMNELTVEEFFDLKKAFAG